MQPKPKVKPAKPKKAPQPKQSDDENGEPNNSNRRKSARLSGKVLTVIHNIKFITPS